MGKKRVLLLCTPVEGIKNVLPRLEKLFELIHLPNACYKDFEENDFSNVYAIFTNPNRTKIFLGRDIFDSLPNLRVICTASTGTVHIDCNLAKSKDISIVSLKNETDFLSKVTSTAELAFTFLLTVVRHIIPATHDVVDSEWDCDKFIGKQVGDLKVGVLGLGRLGKLFAKYCDCFGAEVSFYDPYVDKVATLNNVSKVENLKDFLCDLDVISIHIHATEQNNKFISNEFLEMCKDDVVIINTARGEVVDEEAMVDFLSRNPKSHYVTDVINDEVVRHRSPILQYLQRSFPNGNVTVTPHIGGMSEGARFLAYNKSLDLFEKYMETENA